MFERSVIMNCDSPVAEGWPDYFLLTVAVDAQPAPPQPVRPGVRDIGLVQQRGALPQPQTDLAGVGDVDNLEPVGSVFIPAILN